MDPKVPRIVVLFANPLVRGAGPRLDFEHERGLIRERLGRAGKRIRVVFDAATTDNLSKYLIQGYDILHYTGHGHPDFLAFEGEAGGLHRLTPKLLQKIVAVGGTPQLRLVFVSACHSEPAARAFVEAGVPHVVGVWAPVPVLDRAATTFARDFYQALAHGRSVRDAFDKSRVAVEADPKLAKAAEEESLKFLLLPDDAPHDEVLIADAPDGELDDVTPTPAPHYLPARDESFRGRGEEIHRALSALGAHRFVTLHGAPGIGKTQVAIETARWLLERHRFPDGVFLADLRGLTTAGAMRTEIAARLSLEPEDDEDLARGIGQRGMLLVLDNLEDVLEADGKAAGSLIDALLHGAPNLRLVASSRRPGGGRVTHGETVVRVPPLAAAEARAAFFARAPGDPPYPWGDPSQPDKDSDEFGRVLGFASGHPLCIRLTARLLQDYDMRDLAAKLEREGAAAVVAEDVPEDERDAMTSLNASLAASYEVVAKHSPDAMRLFGALSLFPAGLLGAVLDEITGLVWRPALRLLRRYGLVEKGHVGHAVVLPPLRSYGASHLADAERRRLVARAQGVYAEAAQAVLAHAGKGRDAVAEAVVRGEEANMLAMVRAEGEPARDADGRTAHGRLVVAVGRLLASVLDRPGDAEAVLRVGEARARATGDPRSRAEILKVMGDAAVLRGAHSAGLDRYQQALALCEEHGDVATEAETAAAIGNLIASTGDVSAARAWLRRAWTRHRDSGAPVEVGRMLGLAAIVAAQADPRWALRIGRAACRLARNAQDAFAEQLCWASEAGYWFAAARVACAVLASETALGLSPSVTPRRPHVEALEMQRGVLAEAGNRPGSLACLRGILETCRELKDVHMPPHEARWAEVQEEAQRDEELAELLALIEKAPEAVRKAAVAHELSRMSEEDKREFEELKPATMEEIDRWLKDGTIPE